MQMAVESPGAPGSATGANEIARKSSPASEYSAFSPQVATFFWDRQSHSVQPLRELGAVLG